MMPMAKRIMACCLLLLVLMMNSVLAEPSFLVVSQDWDMASQGLDVLLKATVTTHMPFDADRLTMLTPITDMLSLRLITGADEGCVGVRIDGYDALSLQYKGNALQLSSMADTTFVSQADTMSLLLGSDTSIASSYEALGLSPDGESLIVDGRQLLKQLPDVLADYGKESKSATNISGYGQSTYRLDFTITAKQADNLGELLLSACPEGWLKEIISALVFSGKQTLRMYFTADDVLLRAEYNGACGTEGDLRTVKLVVRTLEDAVTDKIYVELTSPAKSGKNKNTLTFERTCETNKKGAKVIQGDFNYTVTSDGVTSVRKGEFELQNAWNDASDIITGNITFENKLNGAAKATTLTLKPNLSISGTASSPVVNGTLQVTEKYAGKTTEDALLTIEAKAAEPLVWQETATTVDLDALNADALAHVQHQAAATVATAIVQPLIIMMGEDAQWFFRDLPEEAVQTLIEMAQMPVQ